MSVAANNKFISCPDNTFRLSLHSQDKKAMKGRSTVET